MDKAIAKIGDKALFKAIVIRKSGEGEPTISNFDIRTEMVKSEEYANYDGVCVDGQHRTLALLCRSRDTSKHGHSCLCRNAKQW